MKTNQQLAQSVVQELKSSFKKIHPSLSEHQFWVPEDYSRQFVSFIRHSVGFYRLSAEILHHMEDLVHHIVDLLHHLDDSFRHLDDSFRHLDAVSDSRKLHLSAGIALQYAVKMVYSAERSISFFSAKVSGLIRK